MSSNLPLLALQPDDITKMLAAAAHIGATQCSAQMVQYVYKCRSDGIHILKIDRMWEKLMLAARAVAAVEHPQDIFAVSTRPHGQRAVLKFAHFTRTTPIAGRFTPGTFTNQAQKGFREPRLLIVTDPLADHQAIYESAYANVPVVAFCNTDARLKYVDVAVPCNTKSVYAIGLMWWLLTREVLRLRGELSRALPWSVVPDLYFYRDPEEVAKEEQDELEVRQVTQLVEAVSLAAGVPAAGAPAAEEDEAGTRSAASSTGKSEANGGGGGGQWPDMFKIADWNEEVEVDGEAMKARTASAATWGAENGLF